MMRSFLLRAKAVMCIPQSSGAQQTRTMASQFGILGERDLTATLTKEPGGQWVGPARLKQVGYCTVDGLEEKIGDLQLIVADRAAG
jgi:hypothetical protein